ncbi:MAG TPA: glycosyltransferase family 39 protein, partial [Gemmatimonadales bacterium]
MPTSSHRTAFASRLPPATWWIVLGLVWIVSAAYVWHGLDRGWIPHDEGTLAQSAERVLDGELPHRDFDEVYTGALSFLNAAAFRVFGTTLRSLRLPLFCVFLLWVPALYYVATRFAAPPLAGVVTALGAAWSLPQYTAAMPSWYNLFLATFGTAALLRHIETGHRRWLFAAGVAGGVSCLIKIVGLFYVAAVLIFLVYRERTLLDSTPSRPGRRWGGGAYPVAVGAGLGGFVVLLAWLVRGQLAVPEIVHFVLPGAALAAFVTWECASAERGGGERWAALLRLVAPFALGVAIPVVLFVIPYVQAGAAVELWGGVFITPFRRLDFAASRMPEAATLLGALPVALLLGLVPLSPGPARRLLLAVLLVALIAFFILSRHAVWYTIRPLVPLTVIAGVWMLLRHRETLSSQRRQQVLLVLSITALWSLV